MRALVSRPREDAGRIAAPLRAMGVEVINEPLLVIVPVAGPNVDLSGVQAVLLTSANGARALATAVDRRDVPIFAVGDQTTRTARDLGFTAVESADGDVATLAALVRARLDPADGPLLHAAGSSRAGDLAGDLAQSGFRVKVARLYDARATAALSAPLRQALKRGEIDVAFFYSPRTARTFVEHVRKAGLEADLHGLTAYALSPAVARELDPVLSGRIRVAEQPTQESLLALFQSDVKEAPLKPPETPETGTPDNRTGSDRTAAPENDTTPAAATAAPEGEAGAESEAERAPESAQADGPDAAAADGPETGHPDKHGHDDGEAVYAGSAGRPAEPARPAAPTEEEQAEHRTLRSLVRWVVVLVVLGALAFGSMPWWRDQVPAPLQAWLPEMPAAPEPPAVVDLRAQVADLSGRVDDLSRQVAAAAGTAEEALQSATTAPEAMPAGTADAGALGDLRDRLAALEGRVQQQGADAVGAEDSATAAAVVSEGRLAALESAAETLGETQAALADRVAALESAMGGDDEARAVGLVLALGLLRERVDSGKPYTEALHAVAAIGPGEGSADAMATLTAHADTGAMTLADLGRAYAAVSRQAARRVIVPEGDGWWTDTVSSLMSGVTVRRKDEIVAGGSLSALSTAETRLGDGDLTGAIAALSTLEGDPADAVADWLADAETRASVDAALASLNAAALERVGAAQTTE